MTPPLPLILLAPVLQGPPPTPAAAYHEDALSAPVRLEVDGAPLDISEGGTAYAGPLAHGG